MRTTTSGDAAALRPVLVRWPADADRRAWAAAEGRPCLLVVAVGTELPIPGELEDWVAASASERDVAARLEDLESFARSRPVGPRSVVDVPPALRGSDRRLARMLLSSGGHVVPREWLADAADLDRGADLDDAITRLRAALAGTPWRIDQVAQLGFRATSAGPS